MEQAPKYNRCKAVLNPGLVSWVLAANISRDFNVTHRTDSINSQIYLKMCMMKSKIHKLKFLAVVCLKLCLFTIVTASNWNKLAHRGVGCMCLNVGGIRTT